METFSWLQIATYVFCALIIISFAAKVVRYAKMPPHLRWELYPLPGDTKRPWGGSYLEESEWWTKPREAKSLLGELKFMGREVLFFKEYYHRNRSYWYLVYPFHMGIFLFVGFFALLLVGALTMVGGVAVSAESANAWGKVVYYMTLVVGGAGFVLGIVGGVGLFIRRLIDQDLKPYTERIGYFNLLFVLVVFLTGLFSWAFADHTFATAREYVNSLITFKGAGNIDTLIAAHIILLALLLAYMPFTNMMHFFAKWFSFHRVRWDDVPNLRGSNLERRLGPWLNQPVSWSAPHIQRVKRWADVAQATTVQHAPRPRIMETTAEQHPDQSQKEVS